jgi:hypothetical protein
VPVCLQVASAGGAESIILSVLVLRASTTCWEYDTLSAVLL